MNAKAEKKILDLFKDVFSSEILLKLAVEHRAKALRDNCELPDEELSAAKFLEECASKLAGMGM
jgi:hypothetical protein